MQTGKWGNGLAVHLPEALMAQLGLGVGSTLTLEVRDGALVMRPGRPSLKDMLATCALKKIGSSRITGKSGFDLQEEVVAVPVAIGHALDDLDPVVHTLQHAGVETIGGA